MKPLDYYFDTTASGEGCYSQRFYRFLVFLVRILFGALFRFKAVNKELFKTHLDEGKGFMMVGNHRSYLDPLFIMGIIGPTPVRYMAKEEFFSLNPIVGHLAAMVGAFPVKRSSTDTVALKRSVRMLKRHEIVGIFPEGTRVRFADQEVTYHEGVAMISSMGKVPVMPFRLWNTEYIKPKGVKLFCCPKVFVRFGQPLSIADERFASLPKEQRYEVFTKAVMDSVYALELPPELAGKQAKIVVKYQAKMAKLAAKDVN